LAKKSQPAERIAQLSRQNLHEPLGLREIAALVFTLGGVALALRS
jgi:hypothetical protein